jgi:hypothetical protein
MRKGYYSYLVEILNEGESIEFSGKVITKMAQDPKIHVHEIRVQDHEIHVKMCYHCRSKLHYQMLFIKLLYQVIFFSK